MLRSAEQRAAVRGRRAGCCSESLLLALSPSARCLMSSHTGFFKRPMTWKLLSLKFVVKINELP